MVRFSILFHLLIVLLTFGHRHVNAQQANTIEDAARIQLDKEVSSGKLKAKIDKAGIKGTYRFDITIQGKGDVLTVFAYSNDLTDIPSQNALKTLVQNVKFDLYVPDGVRVKFYYIFNL